MSCGLKENNMLFTFQQFESWCVSVLATTVANIITFLIFTSVTKTGWFRILLKRITDDLNKLDPKDADISPDCGLTIQHIPKE